MDQTAVVQLLKDEIDTYKIQIGNLNNYNKICNDNNATLLSKVRNLEDLLEKAKIANSDLHTAFETVREENLKLATHTGGNSLVSATQSSENNDQALESVQDQYVNLARASVSWLSDREKMSQRITFLERECGRYERDNKTLGHQVRHLLKTLEEERGMIIRRHVDVEPIGCASDVIDQHLVTFESIGQLQQQNEKLLSLVKEMSSREEERETQVETEEVRRLNEDIEELKTQLEGIKSDRERLLEAFNTIHKERDLFKILLSKTRQAEHLTPEIFQRMVSVACSSGPAITNGPENTEDKDAHISDLKSMISKLENDITDLRAEFETARVRGEEDLKLKSELLEKAHLKIVEETKRASTLAEQNEVLESNFESLTTQYDEIRTKSQKLMLELEQIKLKNEELTESLEQEKANQKSELSRLLSETQERQKVELTRVLAELQERQNREWETRITRETELQVQLNTTKSEIARLESQLTNQTALQTELMSFKQRASELALEVEQLKLKNQELAHMLEQEKATRNNDISRVLSASQQTQKAQARQDTETQALLANARAQTQRLESQLAELEESRLRDIAHFQTLRNYERQERLNLLRSIRAPQSQTSTSCADANYIIEDVVNQVVLAQVEPLESATTVDIEMIAKTDLEQATDSVDSLAQQYEPVESNAQFDANQPVERFEPHHTVEQFQPQQPVEQFESFTPARQLETLTTVEQFETLEPLAAQVELFEPLAPAEHFEPLVVAQVVEQQATGDQSTCATAATQPAEPKAIKFKRRNL